MPRKYDFTPEQCKEMDLKKICNAFFVENEVGEKNRYSNTIEMIEFIKSYIITNKTLAELIKDDAVFERYNFILMKSKVNTAYDTTKNIMILQKINLLL